jgi:hypothetical protein
MGHSDSPPVAPLKRVGESIEPGQCRIMLGRDPHYDVYLVLGPSRRPGMWWVLATDTFHQDASGEYKPEICESTESWLLACDLLEDLNDFDT